MVQYSPDTAGNYAGYDHGNKQATGFSMTHASVGCAAFGDISMLPTTTSIGSEPWDRTEEIAHDNTEVGVPGYYSVRFPTTGVTAELTATTHTGVGRFIYPDNGRPALFHVNSGASLGGTSAANIQIGDDNTTITGSATSGGFCGKDNVYTVYFAMKFSRPFTSYGTWDGFSIFADGRSAYSSYTGSSGGYVGFPTGSRVEVQHRAVLRQPRRSASQPRRRGPSELRQRARRRIERVERQAVPHHDRQRRLTTTSRPSTPRSTIRC